MRTTPLFLVVVLAWAGLLAGCGDGPPAKTAAGARTGAAQPKVAAGPAAAAPGAVSSQIAVSGEIARLCDLKAPEKIDGKGAPHFAFDSSNLNPDDRSLLSQVARCFTSGPLKGRDMRLTGRADARGEPEYNMNLGAERSGSVRSYLGSLGVASNQMQATSRGELDATGTNEAGYALDRRVDIDLAN